MEKARFDSAAPLYELFFLSDNLTVMRTNMSVFCPCGTLTDWIVIERDAFPGGVGRSACGPACGNIPECLHRSDD